MAEQKPALVLLHGWGATGAVWQASIQYLKRHYVCYSPDLPGHGDSRLTATQLRPLAAEILAVVNRPAIWLGWSLGALVAMQAALLMPQQVRRLLLVSATPAFVRRNNWRHAVSADVFAQFYADFCASADKTFKRFISLQARGDRQAKAVTRQLTDAATAATRFPVNPANIEWGLAVLRDDNLLAELPLITCPVHCLYGANDALTPVTVAEVMRDQVRADVTIWRDAAHAPFAARADIFAHWVRAAARE